MFYIKLCTHPPQLGLTPWTGDTMDWCQSHHRHQQEQQDYIKMLFGASEFYVQAILCRDKWILALTASTLQKQK